MTTEGVQARWALDSARETDSPTPAGAALYPSALTPLPVQSVSGQRSYASLVARIIHAIHRPLSCHVYGQQFGPAGAEQYDLFLIHVPAAANTLRPRRTLLNGGTHGNEPAGRGVRHHAVRQSLGVCPRPAGEGPGGPDLNRCFPCSGDGGMDGHSPAEVVLLQCAIGSGAFDTFIDCHEDIDAPGFYVFAPAQSGTVIAAAAGTLGPLHPGSLVDGEFPLTESVVELDPPQVREKRCATGATDARHLPRGSFAASLLESRLSRGVSATIETPALLPLEQCVAMQLAALEAVLAAP